MEFPTDFKGILQTYSYVFAPVITLPQRKRGLEELLLLYMGHSMSDLARGLPVSVNTHTALRWDCHLLLRK